MFETEPRDSISVLAPLRINDRYLIKKDDDDDDDDDELIEMKISSANDFFLSCTRTSIHFSFLLQKKGWKEKADFFIFVILDL